MTNNSSKIKTAFSLFAPSGIGVVLYTFFAALIITLHTFTFIKQYLQLPQDINLFPVIINWLDRTLTGLVGQSAKETLVVGLFWAFVGLGVYVFLHGVARFITELGEGLERRKFLWPRGADRNRPLVEAVERTLFQLFALLGLLYMVFGPLAQVLSGPVWTSMVGDSTPLRLTVWFLAIWLTLHACVVLARLVALRHRLFS